jgi:hypothetical protein
VGEHRNRLGRTTPIKCELNFLGGTSGEDASILSYKTKSTLGVDSSAGLRLSPIYKKIESRLRSQATGETK